MVSADKILSKSQFTKLFKVLEHEKSKSIVCIEAETKNKRAEIRSVMDFYIFSFIANTGLRVSEATKLLNTDIHEDFVIIRAALSKNKKKGTVYYGPRTKKLVGEVLEFKKAALGAESDFLFSLTSKPLSRSYLHTRFKHWLQLAGLPNHFSIHSLRHTYATRCLNEGLSITFVRDNLRHSNLSITSQYLHLTKENREKVKEIF